MDCCAGEEREPCPYPKQLTITLTRHKYQFNEGMKKHNFEGKINTFSLDNEFFSFKGIAPSNFFPSFFAKTCPGRRVFEHSSASSQRTGCSHYPHLVTMRRVSSLDQCDLAQGNGWLWVMLILMFILFSLGVFAFCWRSFVKGPEIVSIKFLRQKN